MFILDNLSQAKLLYCGYGEGGTIYVQSKRRPKRHYEINWALNYVGLYETALHSEHCIAQ